MTTVNVRDYPADRLPQDIRDGIDSDARVDVRVTRRGPADGQRRRSLVELLTGGPTVFASAAAIEAHIEELRGSRSDA